MATPCECLGSGPDLVCPIPVDPTGPENEQCTTFSRILGARPGLLPSGSSASKVPRGPHLSARPPHHLVGDPSPGVGLLGRCPNSASLEPSTLQALSESPQLEVSVMYHSGATPGQQ